MPPFAKDPSIAALAKLLENPVTAENVAQLRETADTTVAKIRATDCSKQKIGSALAEVLEMRGNLMRDLGEEQEAQSDYFEALGLLISARDADEAVGRVSASLAVIHDFGGDPNQAKPHYERAISSFESLRPPSVLDIASLSNNLAFIYEAEGDFAKAEGLLLAALETSQNTLGANSEQTAALYNNIGTLYFKSGHDERAREMHMMALDARNDVFGDNHVETAQSHGNLALVFVKSGELNAAKRHFTSALDAYEQNLDIAQEDYDVVFMNYRDVLESVDDKRALAALDMRRVGGPPTG